ncbi:SRPBCC family protein [Streptomyces sp. NPDC005438]|uniref:SRPBCC family protein n=1 Tax=Streptomyces sp. NPDC005438 TaxID=3156880 RepID=UPI0033BDDEFE
MAQGDGRGRGDYRFRHRWRLPARPSVVFAVLERVEEYPRWWPQVRGVEPLGPDRGTARFRSLLPVELVVTARATRRDPEAGVLQIAMAGDLCGWARWTLSAVPGGTEALYEQRVEVRKPWMRRLSWAGRPFFVANHALMMRAGRRGLIRRLRTGLDDD